MRKDLKLGLRSQVKTEDLVRFYTVQHLTLREIASLYNGVLTHAGIWKRLKRAGVQAEDGEHVQVECDFCGLRYDLTRKRWKSTQGHYHSFECYAAARENPNYVPWRYGQKVARAIVSRYFDLLEGYVVHHIDGDCHNNSLKNLQVFASQSDHQKHHHGKSLVRPAWEGLKVS